MKPAEYNSGRCRCANVTPNYVVGDILICVRGASSPVGPFPECTHAWIATISCALGACVKQSAIVSVCKGDLATKHLAHLLHERTQATVVGCTSLQCCPCRAASV